MPKIILNDGLTFFEEVVGTVVETIDPASIAASGTATAEIDVPGAAIGDYVLVAPGVDMQGLLYSGYVSAAGKVEIAIFNPTAGAVDLAQSDWKVKVLR